MGSASQDNCSYRVVTMRVPRKWWLQQKGELRPNLGCVLLYMVVALRARTPTSEKWQYGRVVKASDSN